MTNKRPKHGSQASINPDLVNPRCSLFLIISFIDIHEFCLSKLNVFTLLFKAAQGKVEYGALWWLEEDAACDCT